MYEKLLKDAVISPYGIVVSVDDLRAARCLRRRLYSDRCHARKSGATELDQVSILIKPAPVPCTMRSLARPSTSACHPAAAAIVPLTLTSQRRTAGENLRPRPKRRYITFQFFAFHGGHWRIVRSAMMRAQPAGGDDRMTMAINIAVSRSHSAGVGDDAGQSKSSPTSRPGELFATRT